MTDRSQFKSALESIFQTVDGLGLSFVDIKAGDLHRIVGGYPGSDHRMPICCDVMYEAIVGEDSILEKPPRGKGASLIIRYMLPR